MSFDFNVAYSSCWGYSLINTLKLNKTAGKNCCLLADTRIVWSSLVCRAGRLLAPVLRHLNTLTRSRQKKIIINFAFSHMLPLHLNRSVFAAEFICEELLRIIWSGRTRSATKRTGRVLWRRSRRTILSSILALAAACSHWWQVRLEGMKFLYLTRTTSRLFTYTCRALLRMHVWPETYIYIYIRMKTHTLKIQVDSHKYIY